MVLEESHAKNLLSLLPILENTHTHTQLIVAPLGNKGGREQGSFMVLI